MRQSNVRPPYNFVSTMVLLLVFVAVVVVVIWDLKVLLLWFLLFLLVLFLAHLLSLFLVYIFSSFSVSVKGFQYDFRDGFGQPGTVISSKLVVYLSLSLSYLSDELTEFWFVFSFVLCLSFFFPLVVPFSVFPLISVMVFCFCFLILIGIPNKELKSFWTGRFRDIFALKPISEIRTITTEPKYIKK